VRRRAKKRPTSFFFGTGLGAPTRAKGEFRKGDHPGEEEKNPCVALPSPQAREPGAASQRLYMLKKHP